MIYIVMRFILTLLCNHCFISAFRVFDDTHLLKYTLIFTFIITQSRILWVITKGGLLWIMTNRRRTCRIITKKRTHWRCCAGIEPHIQMLSIIILHRLIYLLIFTHIHLFQFSNSFLIASRHLISQFINFLNISTSNDNSISESLIGITIL